MANQFMQAGRLDQARSLYQQVLDDNPKNIHAILSLAEIYTRQEMHEQAVLFLSKAVDLAPDNAQTHFKLASLYVDREQFAQAGECFRRVLDMHPDHIGSLVAFANITRQTGYTKHIQSMEEIYENPDLPESDHRRLAFALGKVFDELGDFDKAFRYFQAGNRIARAQYEYSTEAAAHHLQQIKEYFDAGFFWRNSEIGIEDSSLIIVTGMPRSGTTLIEQILASHPDVYGAGEVSNLKNIILELEQEFGTRFPVGFDTLDPALMNDMARQYVTGLQGLAGGESHITDKNLASLLYLGLIGVMLPNAKIIHCNRDPRDQGLSFFQKDFSEYQVYSYDLKEIGEYYNCCRDMMDYWHHMMPGRIYSIQYEEVVSDLEGNVRRLLEYCDLPFDPACLSFHSTERAIKTASHIQVRQPLYASSVGRWKNYEQYLQPLTDALKE